MIRKSKKVNPLRRSTAVLSATLILCSCSRYLVSDTWAWFTDDSAAASASIQAARLSHSVTVTWESPEGETLMLVPSGGAYRLETGTAYTITITPTIDSTAARGYGTITSDGAFAAVTENVPREGLTFTLIPEEGDGSYFRFHASWGVFHDSVSAVGMEDIRVIRHGDLIGRILDQEDQTEPTEDTTEPTEETMDPTEETLESTEETVESTEETSEPTEETTEPAGEATEPSEETTESGVDPVADTLVSEMGFDWLFPEESRRVTADGVNLAQSPFFGKSQWTMPLYFQTDYPDVRYGAGTLETSGCGIVSLSMTATYITGYEYRPDELARYFGGRAENNMARMEAGADALGLQWEKAENFHHTRAALEEGKIVIALMEGYDGDCPFTQSQHFVVLTGLTENGDFLVHDPYAPNYDKWDLKEGFEKGFDSYTILTGYTGGWIFDPQAIPADLERYYERTELIHENYPDVNLTWEEQEIIAKVIWAEAQGEPAQGQQAVAEVILNRLISQRFGDTVKDVIYSEGQFRSVPKIPEATPWQAQYDALDAALYGESILDRNVYFFATHCDAPDQWGRIGGHYFWY